MTFMGTFRLGNLSVVSRCITNLTRGKQKTRGIFKSQTWQNVLFFWDIYIYGTVLYKVVEIERIFRFGLWILRAWKSKKSRRIENDNSLRLHACPKKAADRIGTLNSITWICLSSKNVLPSGGLILMKSHGIIRKHHQTNKCKWKKKHPLGLCHHPSLNPYGSGTRNPILGMGIPSRCKSSPWRSRLRPQRIHSTT